LILPYPANLTFVSFGLAEFQILFSCLTESSTDEKKEARELRAYSRRINA
jgi:hypothetical protein